MKKRILILLYLTLVAKMTFGQQVLGEFTGNDQVEWPKVIWYRDIQNGWDEGLIKHSSSEGVFGRAGFGIHLHESRDFTFLSTGWNTLFSIKGGTGDAYLKGKLGIGMTSPLAVIDVFGGNGTYVQPTVRLKSNSLSQAWSLVNLNGGTFDETSDYMIGRGDNSYNDGRALTIHIPSRLNLYNDTGKFPQIAFVSSNSTTLGYIQAETGNWYIKGSLGIGTTSPGSGIKLDVIGTIRASEIKVDLNGADFVFEKGYNLMSLSELEMFVKNKKHLPEVESAKEMKENGADLGSLNSKLLQKVEEMTLYMIEQNKKLEQQNKKIMALEKEMKRKKKR
ncbi:MAG TPA: hypothetical protein VJ602_03240 [Paludibacter sp.]|nr:hypothetical protein [Paludibacter sp.]